MKFIKLTAIHNQESKFYFKDIEDRQYHFWVNPDHITCIYVSPNSENCIKILGNSNPTKVKQSTKKILAKIESAKNQPITTNKQL